MWPAQIPGSGRNLVLSVWLSPDTRGPATKEPRQNNLAGAGVARGRGSGPHCLFRAWGWRRAAERNGWPDGHALISRGLGGLEGFSRKRSYSDMSLCPLRVTSSLLRCPVGPTVPSFGPQWPCWHCQQTSLSSQQPEGPAHTTDECFTGGETGSGGEVATLRPHSWLTDGTRSPDHQPAPSTMCSGCSSLEASVSTHEPS